MLSATGIASYNTMIYIGLQYTTAMNALLLQSAMPVIILLWAFVLFGESASLQQMIGVMFSLLGVAIIVSNGSLATWHISPSAPAMRGFWAALSSSRVSTALAAPTGRASLELSRRGDGHRLFADAAALLVEIATGATIYGGLSSYAAIAYTAVLPSFVGFYFFNRGWN